MSTALALQALFHAQNEPSVKCIEIEFEGRKLLLAKSDTTENNDYIPIDGSGGLKKIYGLNDGRAIALPNLDELVMPSGMARTWERVVMEEKAESDKVLAAGLEAQDISIGTIKIGGNEMPIMIMPRFAALEQQGIQVRDGRNQYSSRGHSMFYGTPQNAEDPQRLKMILNNLMDDLVTAMAHGIGFYGDRKNLIIKDTDDTPAHDRSKPGLFDERHQSLRLFLFDFSSKAFPVKDYKPEYLDEQGNPNLSNIKEAASHYVVQAKEAVLDCITSEEVSHILKLKESFSSENNYDEFDIYPLAFEKHFEEIYEELAATLATRVVDEIYKLPLSERLKRFDRPDGSPPLNILLDEDVTIRSSREMDTQTKLS